MRDLDWRDLSGSRLDRRTLLKFGALTGGLAILAACSAPPAAPAGTSAPAAAAPTSAPPSTAPTSAPAAVQPTAAAAAAQPTAAAAAAPTQGGTLVAGWNVSDIAFLDPAFINTGNQMEIATNIMSGLVRLTPDIGIEGDLAEDWEVSQDGKTYTFNLRKGVVWHNGDKFTSKDVVFTFNRTNNEATGSPHRAKLGQVASVEAKDDFTVVFTLKNPYSPLLAGSLTAFPGRAMTAVNERALTDLGPEKYKLMPVGTGPFKVTKHESGQTLVLERNPDYFREGQPILEKVEYKFLREPSALASALQAGDVQMVNHVPGPFIEQLKADSNIYMDSVPGTNWYGVQLSYKHEHLGNPKVREAISHALDREEFVTKGLFGNAVAATGVFNPAVKWAYRGDKPDFNQTYDLDLAKKLMAEAGVADGFEAGAVLESQDLRVNEILRDQLSRIGIKVNLETLDTGLYAKRVNELHEFDINLNGSVVDPDPDDSIWNFFNSKGPWNGFHYNNPKADELLVAQRAEMDQEKRAKILWELEDMLNKDNVVIWAYHKNDTPGFRKEVQGFVHVPELRPLHTVYVA